MILIVEDDKVQNDVLANFLQHDGFDVSSAYTLHDAKSMFNDKTKLVVLDLGLPDGNGFDFLKHIRHNSNIPVIVLTALNDEFTQLNAFGLKADEFIDKPFSPLVMTKRIATWMERFYPKEQTVKICDLTFDFSDYRVWDKLGNEIIITSTEFKILKKLFENKGHAVTRESIIESVWGFEYRDDIRLLDSHIKNIRKKLNADIVTTIKGIGYRINING